MGILVVGSVAYDSVKTPHGHVERAMGGSATFFSAAATHFSPVRIVGVVGRDFDFGDYEFLKKRGADIRGLEVMDGETFQWKGEYSGDMNEAKTLSTCLNVFETFAPELNEDYRKSGYVFLGNIDPDLQLKVINQITMPAFVALDTMNLWINTRRDSLVKAISKVDMVIMNIGEALSFTGASNIVCAAADLSNMGPRAVIVKKGEHGAYMLFDSRQFALPAYPMGKVVDPTGAGDSFAGGVMGYLANCRKITFRNLKRAMVYGTLMASFNVESFSVIRLKNLKKSEIRSRYIDYLKIFSV